VRNPFQIGERLYLRALEVSDAAQVCGWLNHPDVRRFLARNTALNLAGEEDFIRGLPNRPGDEIFVIALHQGNRDIGVVGLHGFQNAARRGVLGITIGEPDCWGQGYGAEAIDLVLEHAFGELNLHRVELCVYATNARGIACYEKLGFVREGAKREAMVVDGEYVDEVFMGLLRREWRAKR
jgi:RimJ/RimL family protein N-acetyltransferase